jgi:hypothetical protein
MAAPPSRSATTCPSCGAAASGHFCSSCGAPLGGAPCVACKTPLTRGAKFCHRCGTPVGAGAGAAVADRGLATILPWAVAGIALIALTLVFARQFIRSPAAAPDAPVALQDAGAGDPSAGPMPGVRASTDISRMSPQERADRLFNRIMMYAERGRVDSARFFAPMALSAYEMLGAPDADQRYHIGRIGVVTGDPRLAAAQADTILRTNPTHLLGLILAAEAAELRSDRTAASGYRQRLLNVRATELAKGLPEYEQHRTEIEAVGREDPRS